MLKRTFITLLILISYVSGNNLKAQTSIKDTAAYEYAILELTAGFGDKNLTVIFGSNHNVNILDLDEKLNLDTLQGDTREIRYYKYLFIGMHFMEKIGYELVNYAPSQYYVSCMYRKKKQNNPTSK